jgi:5-methylcytosine-specific restriction endonuclease McrA
MTKRKAITAQMKLDVLRRQNATVQCYRCKEMYMLSLIQFDHVHALCHDGEHATDNLYACCIDCHKDKSREDVRDLAHVRRLTEAQAMHAAIISGDMVKAKSRIPSRPFPKRMKT